MAGRYLDPPERAVAKVRRACAGLPEIVEQRAWAGVRWQVRRRTFAHVLDVDRGQGPRLTMLTFRSEGEELEVLQQLGHPYHHLGWGRDAMGLVLGDATDWDEVRELVAVSYCVIAPKRLGDPVRAKMAPA